MSPARDLVADPLSGPPAQIDWLTVRDFSNAPAADDLATRLLLSSWRDGLAAPADPVLFVDRQRHERYVPIAYCRLESGHGHVQYDASGFVSAVRHAAGYLDALVNAQALPGQAGILTDPGKRVTVSDPTNAPMVSEDHVIIYLERAMVGERRVARRSRRAPDGDHLCQLPGHVQPHPAPQGL